MTWAEYHGLRVLQDLASPYTRTDRPALQKIKQEHPEWLESLEAAHDFLSRVLYTFQRDDALVPTHTPKARRSALRALSVQTAKRLRAGGLTYRDIAARMHLSFHTVYKYCYEPDAPTTSPEP